MSPMPSQRFVIEGAPSDVVLLAEVAGWKITRPRWWQRTADVNVWELRGLWALCALNAIHGVFLIVRWLG